jgi:hypothetical protein
VWWAALYTQGVIAQDVGDRRPAANPTTRTKKAVIVPTIIRGECARVNKEDQTNELRETHHAFLTCDTVAPPKSTAPGRLELPRGAQVRSLHGSLQVCFGTARAASASQTALTRRLGCVLASSKGSSVTRDDIHVARGMPITKDVVKFGTFVVTSQVCVLLLQGCPIGGALYGCDVME